MIVEVTDASFEQEVMQSRLPVVIDFWAEWCGPCRQLMPTVHELSDAYDGKVKFVKANVDDCVELATRFGVMSIPTLVFMKGGEVQRKQVGVTPRPVLVQYLDALL